MKHTLVAVAMIACTIAGSYIGTTWTNAQNAADHKFVEVASVADALYTECSTSGSKNCHWAHLTTGSVNPVNFVQIEGTYFDNVLVVTDK